MPRVQRRSGVDFSNVHFLNPSVRESTLPSAAAVAHQQPQRRTEKASPQPERWPALAARPVGAADGVSLSAASDAHKHPPLPAAGTDGAARIPDGPHPSGVLACADACGHPKREAARAEACTSRDVQAGQQAIGNRQHAASNLLPAADVTALCVGYAIGQMMTFAGVMLYAAPGDEIAVATGTAAGTAILATVLACVFAAEAYATRAERRAAARLTGTDRT